MALDPFVALAAQHAAFDIGDAGAAQPAGARVRAGAATPRTRRACRDWPFLRRAPKSCRLLRRRNRRPASRAAHRREARQFASSSSWTSTRPCLKAASLPSGDPLAQTQSRSGDKGVGAAVTPSAASARRAFSRSAFSRLTRKSVGAGPLRAAISRSSPLPKTRSEMRLEPFRQIVRHRPRHLRVAQRPAREITDKPFLGPTQRSRTKPVAVTACQNRFGPPAFDQNEAGQDPAARLQSRPRAWRSTSRAPPCAAARHRHARRSAPGPWRRCTADGGSNRPRHRRPGDPRSRSRSRISIAAATCAPGVKELRSRSPASKFVIAGAYPASQGATWDARVEPRACRTNAGFEGQRRYSQSTVLRVVGRFAGDRRRRGRGSRAARPR